MSILSFVFVYLSFFVLSDKHNIHWIKLKKKKNNNSPKYNGKKLYGLFRKGNIKFTAKKESIFKDDY